ncbi:MAG: hypothetical protein ACRCSM_06390 [Sediminibacterium sp.]|jgi:hypothetical protein|nr:hypothetical protein [Chitinophagaceae bacterium]MCA6446600.1 hypothetical protein [Chitinophagaceae bacterium]
MRNTILSLLFLLTPFVCIVGQNLNKTDSYLNLPQVSKGAKDFYLGKFKATDDQKTLSILDSLRTKNFKTRPFYLYLTARLSKKTDGALAEAIGESLKSFLERNSNDFIAFLKSGELQDSKSVTDSWAQLIAGEFMLTCEGNSKKCVTQSLNSTIMRTKTDYLQDLKAFYVQVSKYCH